MSASCGVQSLGRPRIMVVGSSNTDMVVKADRLPAPGETIMGGKFVMAPGGKGANQAVAAARLGAHVTFVARLGQDVFGDKALDGFRAAGMDTRFVVRDMDEPTGVALIFVGGDGENEIVVAPGANAALLPEDVTLASDALAECAVMVVQLEIPLETTTCAVRLAHEKGVRVVLNSAPMRAEGLPVDLLKLVDILVANESETRIILGLPADEEIGAEQANSLLQTGVGAAIVTLGARGALLASEGAVVHVPCPSVKAVDTTAAGDAFTGALAAAVGSGVPLYDACDLASKAAALSVTRMGAQSSLPTADELFTL